MLLVEIAILGVMTDIMDLFTFYIVLIIAMKLSLGPIN
jgi:hypothetical protein